MKMCIGKKSPNIKSYTYNEVQDAEAWDFFSTVFWTLGSSVGEIAHAAISEADLK